MLNRDNSTAVTIRSSDGKSSVTFIPAKGGIGSSLVLPVEGISREILFLRDNFWIGNQNIGGWPFLFPVCGRLLSHGRLGQYQWSGAIHHLPMHGFSMHKKWQLEELTAEQVTLSLSDDEETRAVFPFRFYINLRYVISDGTLYCHQRYENRGNAPMPFYAGFHPYFQIDEADTNRWTIEGAIKKIGVYDDTYAQMKEWISYPGEIDVPTSGRIQHVLLLDPHQPVTLMKNGQPYLSMQANESNDDAVFPYLQLYRSGADPFICMEPWMGLPNSLNRPDEVPMIPVGESRRATLAVTSRV